MNVCTVVSCKNRNCYGITFINHDSFQLTLFLLQFAIIAIILLNRLSLAKLRYKRSPNVGESTNTD